MTQTPVTRDEFEVVKELLASAARYAESANRGMDRLDVQLARLESAQERTQAQLDSFISRSDARMERLEASQARTQSQLDLLSQKVDSFISRAQQLHGEHAEKITQLQGISDRLEAILAYVVRKQNEQGNPPGPGQTQN